MTTISAVRPAVKSACLVSLFLAWIAGACMASEVEPGGEAKDSAELTYQGPGGLVFRVTAAGLSEIRVGRRVLAHGGWSVFNADGWFKEFKDAKHPEADEIVTKRIKLYDQRRARVWHFKKDVICTTDYTFDGEDVLISAHVQNNHPDEPINVVGFSGLQFDFDAPPKGLMPVQHVTYFMAHGTRLCHPSCYMKIGGTYAADNTIGIGTSPWKTGWNRTLTLWDYVDWSPDKRENVPQRRPIYFVVSPLPARGSNTYDMKLRVSVNRQWKHLLEPYREHFRQTFGPVRYKADYRWIATDYLNCSQESISPANPYGFHPGSRRWDKAEGIKAFCDAMIANLNGAGGQGVIVWGQGGDDPRGAMYRPDFDVLPPEVEANWPTLAQRFREAGLKLGVATDPVLLAVRQDWKRDLMIASNANDPGHREMILRRFQNMIRKGCTLFYLDCTGDDLEHVKLMRYLRENLGPDVLTFGEHQCDALLPYSGGYSEIGFAGGKPGGTPHYNLWSGADNWEIYRWLTPGAQLAARGLYGVEGKIPENFEPLDRYLYRHHVTPLLPFQDPERLKTIEKIQSQYLDASGGWKE